MQILVEARNRKPETLAALNRVLKLYDAKMEPVTDKTKKDLNETFYDRAGLADQMLRTFKVTLGDDRNAVALYDSLLSEEMILVVVHAKLDIQASKDRLKNIVPPPFPK